MIIGIDLGTTNSCAAAMKDGRPVVVENAEGQRTTPSVVTFRRSGEVFIGQDAKNRRIQDPLDTVWSSKRFMGRAYSSVKEELRHVPYRFTCDSDDNVCILAAGRSMTVVEIASRILSKVRLDAQKALGTTVDEAVITVPAYFTDPQREATREAGRLAGLNVRRIISEPTAAALAYGAQSGFEGTVAVYDLGGGTFDISVLEVKDGSFKVLSTAGDTMLGGDDIDRRVTDWIVREARRLLGFDLFSELEDPVTRIAAAYAMQKARDCAEKAKIELSDKDEAKICIENLYKGMDLSTSLFRGNLEHMVELTASKTIPLCRKALADAGLDKVDKVILVGGSTKSPRVRRIVKETFSIEPDTSLNPDEAVALGAAVQAGILEDGSKSLVDVTPLDLGILCRNGRRTEIAPIIKANTPIPVSLKRTFTTSHERQEALDLTLMQGFSRLATMRVELKPAPKGVPRVVVGFSIDADGILSVSATDTATGAVKRTTITKHVI